MSTSKEPTIILNDDQIHALRRFAKHIDDLEDVYDQLNDMNLFEILGIQQTELKHSNFLGWLFDPSSESGIGDKLIKQLLRFCSKHNEQKPKTKNDLDYVKIEIMDLDEVTVEREHYTKDDNSKYIDLLIYSRVNSFCICIENKINAGEGENQLHDYHEYIENSFARKTNKPGSWAIYKNRYYILLSPTGCVAEKKTDQKNWIPLNYKELADWIEEIYKKYQGGIPEKAQGFIEDYLKALNRNVIEGGLKRQCQEIYNKYLDAFDVFENFEAVKVMRIPNISEEPEGFRLYYKHKTVIDRILKESTHLTEMIKLQITRALEEEGEKVQYGDTVSLLIKIPKDLNCAKGLVDRKRNDVTNDKLFFELYYHRKDRFFYLHLKCRNLPDTFDVGKYGKKTIEEIYKNQIKSKRICPKQTPEYIRDLLKNRKQPYIEDELIKTICQEIISKMRSEEVKTAIKTINACMP